MSTNSKVVWSAAQGWHDGPRAETKVDASGRLTIEIPKIDPIYRGHKLAAIVSETIVGRQWTEYVPSIPFPKVVGTLGSARVATRTKGNIWGLSVSDVLPCGCQEHAR